MNKRLRLPLALSLALGSTSAFALGLGQIEVTSALNQPLAAEIPVLSTLSGETDALVVRLAPPEALARVGLPMPTGVAANLEFALDTNSRGQTIIRVTTPGKVNDPFVSFLLEVDWGQGKILREYTVLLDPPTMTRVYAAPVASTPVSEALPPAPEPLPEPLAEEALPPPAMTESTTEPDPAAKFEPVPEPEPEVLADAPPMAEPEPEPMAEPEPEPVPEPAPARSDTYGPVAAGETLWSIAQYARPDDSVSMNQMMLALLHANPDAFIDQNINRLKKGAILRIPGNEEALAVAAVDAAERVREQMQAWREASAPVVQPAEPEPTETSTSRPVATAPAVPDSRLELVPPKGDAAATSAQSGASVAGEGRELRAELARSREEVSTLSQENVELKSRVGELEKIQQDGSRLIELKDSELAAAQRRLTELEALQAAASQVPVDESPAEPAPSEPVSGADPVADTAASDADVLPPATDAAGADPASASDPVALPVDGSDPTVAADPAAVDDTSVTTDPAVSETAQITAPADVEPTAVVSTVAAKPWYLSPWVLGGVGLVVVGLLALLLGRRRSPSEVAPAGRYKSGDVASTIAAVQAKATTTDEDEAEIDHAARLAEAIARAPANLARHLDLVRYHYEADNAAGFEHAAEAMYSRVYDPDDLAWKQVVAMGREIAPDHPLFVHNEAAVPETMDPTPKSSHVAREVEWGAKPLVVADSATTQQIRLDDVKTAYTTQAKPPLAVPPMQPVPEISVPALEEFSFEPSPAAAEPPISSSDGFLDADASSTKLELARAYLDMGDVEGARGMLEEVVSEGNPGQRAEAKRLLDEIR